MSIQDRNIVEKAMNSFLTDEAKREIDYFTKLVIATIAQGNYEKELKKSLNKDVDVIIWTEEKK